MTFQNNNPKFTKMPGSTSDLYYSSPEITCLPVNSYSTQPLSNCTNLLHLWPSTWLVSEQKWLLVSLKFCTSQEQVNNLSLSYFEHSFMAFIHVFQGILAQEGSGMVQICY
jgi:hypothetical protein